MSPEQAEEYGPDDEYDDDHQEDAPEWQAGECDMCAGPPKTQAEQAAVMASSVIPVCACWMGQGAAPADCLCGPELFEGNLPSGCSGDVQEQP